MKRYIVWTLAIIASWYMFGGTALSVGHQSLRAVGNIPHHHYTPSEYDPGDCDPYAGSC